MFTLQFEIKDPKVISTNDMYYHPVKKTKNGRYVSYFCPSATLKDLQRTYAEILPDLISDDDIKEMKSHIERKGAYGIELKLEYGMPSSQLWEHDVSNFVKSVEDCIVKRTGIDDIYHTRVVLEKSIYDSFTENWMLRVTMSVYQINKYIPSMKEGNGGNDNEIKSDET